MSGRLPFSAHLRRRDLRVRIGFSYPWPTWMQINAGLRFHFGWEKDGELPGLHLWIDVAWLHLWLTVGAGWTDEDGEHRTFLSAGAYLKTYGLRYVGCWFGHKPERCEYTDRYYVSCSRCDADLEDGPLSAGWLGIHEFVPTSGSKEEQ